jgi:hypothetical protein
MPCKDCDELRSSNMRIPLHPRIQPMNTAAVTRYRCTECGVLWERTIDNLSRVARWTALDPSKP